MEATLNIIGTALLIWFVIWLYRGHKRDERSAIKATDLRAGGKHESAREEELRNEDVRMSEIMKVSQPVLNTGMGCFWGMGIFGLFVAGPAFLIMALAGIGNSEGTAIAGILLGLCLLIGLVMQFKDPE